MVFYFTNEIEIALFKEVINLVPYNYEGKENKEVWKEVVQNVSLALGLNEVMLVRTAKTKVDTQLKFYITENNEMLRKSGSDEDLDEKKSLLQEILMLMDAGIDIIKQKRKDKAQAKKDAKKKLQLKKKGKDIRLRAMEGLKDNKEDSDEGSGSDDAQMEGGEGQTDENDQQAGTSGEGAAAADDGPTKGKKRVSTTTKQLCLYEVLKYKFEKEAENKEKELNLENRRLKLQERRMDMEEADRKEREAQKKAYVEAQKRYAVQKQHKQQQQQQPEFEVDENGEVYQNLKNWEM